MIFTMAKQSSNPENIISEYIDSSRVSVDFRIQVLDAALGLGSPLVDNSGNPIQIELSGPQLSKIVCAAARQQVTKIFQVCLNLLRGASTRLSEFIDSLVKELTSNPLALHRMSEVMSLVRQHDKEHRASGQFLSLYYAGMEASKPKPKPEYGHLQLTPTTPTRIHPRRPPGGVLSNWYQHALLKEAELS